MRILRALTDANLEALSLYQLYQEFGVSCDGSGTGTVTGGYGVTLWRRGAGLRRQLNRPGHGRI